jgi:CARDB
LKLLSEPSGSRHRLAWMVGAFALVSCALLGIVARAQASETLYWDNYHGDSIGAANIDGSGGHLLGLGKTGLDGPEGLAFDPTNDRLYIADSGNSVIDWVGINGGAGVLDTGTAPVHNPSGIAVDPATNTVYWGNGSGNEPIGYADANGSGVGGALNVEGSSGGRPSRIALDTTDGRVYWIGMGLPEEHASYANLNNTGGGDLPVAEEELPEGYSGLSVEPATGRLYILAEEQVEFAPGEFEEVDFVYWVNLSGLGGGEVDTSNAPLVESYGLAVDPSVGRFYWANYGAEVGDPPFGFASLAPGGGGSITIAEGGPEVLADGPPDPIVLKGPTWVAAPQVTASGTSLSCSQGEWSQDYAGSNVYGAPESYGYQWSKDGQPILGATGTTVDASSPGAYRCLVTATNQFGAGLAASDPYTVSPPATSTTQSTPSAVATPASLGLTAASKTKIKVAAGKIATLSLTLKNTGGTASSSTKVCLKLAKKAKKGLVAPKCVAVAALAPGASKPVTLKVKTKGGAKGTYKFSVVAGGASGSATLAQQITVTPKKHGKKRHEKK